MTIYYKCTRPDGTDFRTGKVLYQVGKTVMHPAARKVRNDPSTYLSVSTVPTDCTGFKWPCRLFAVEGVGRPMSADDLPNKRCFSSVRVVEELPAWQVFGPQGEQVVAILERARTLTADEARRLRAAWDATRDATWDAAWDATWAATRDAAWDAAWDATRDATWDAAWDAAWDATWAATRDAAWAATRDAAWDAAYAFLTRDLITPEQFEILVGPWTDVIGGVS